MTPGLCLDTGEFIPASELNQRIDMRKKLWPEWNQDIERGRVMKHELPPLPPHPEHHSMTWSSLERRAILEYARQVAEQVAEPLLARIALLEAQLASGQEPVATVIKNGASREWMSERLGKFADGIYSLYAHPAPAQQPLRRDEVADLHEETEPLCSLYTFRDIVADIEAKHGIKEKP